MPAFVATLAAALLLAVPAGGTLTSGLHGHVTIGPLTPLCSDTTPCDGPAKGVTLSFFHTGYLTRRVTTDDAGRYRLLLRPGVWAVRASRGMRLTPAQVTVRKGLVSLRSFAIDTGIR